MLASILKGDLSTVKKINIFLKLEELTSTGKSGSFFYYSGDGRFTLKTVHRGEFKFLKSILESYYGHLNKFNQTLIVKY
jgi:1-phosphatidylinositol-4-phosphate 5-kinase